jgi:hypothetical protein
MITFAIPNVLVDMNLSQSFLFFTLCVLLCINSSPSFAQRASANAAQRFSLKVNKMMDIGFENNQSAPPQNKLDDIMKGAPASYTFRLRTNERFRVSLSTNNNDSSGTSTDSLLQVSIGNKENDTSGYKDVSATPQTLFTGTENTDQAITIKYRAKPGAVIPQGLKKLDLIYTACHP